MSTENSGTKWIVGCLVAGVVVVLLCGGTLALLGFLGYRAVEKVVQEAGPQMQHIAFADTWTPPLPDAGPNDLFPQTLGAWSRTDLNDSAAIPELAIDRDGQHGVYESGGNNVDIYAYSVPTDEQLSVFDAAVRAIDDANYSSQSKMGTDYGISHWMTFSFDPPPRYGRMWWAKDWLFVTMTDAAGVNLEDFERIYLTAIQGPPEPGSLDGAPLDEPVTEEPQLDSDPTAADAGGSDAPAVSQPDSSGGAEATADDPDAAPNPDDVPANSNQ